LLNLNSVARSGARGVRGINTCMGVPSMNRKLPSVGLIFAMLAMTFIPIVTNGQNDSKMDAMILNGKDWMFSVKEPKGWAGTIEGADAVPANVMFFPVPLPSGNAKPLIYIQLTSKTTEDMNSDLEADMNGFKKRVPKVVFKDVAVHHEKYALAPKAFIVEGKYCEYVTYLNPGKAVNYKLAVVLRVHEREATDSELEAYRAVISSVLWWEGVVPITKGN
jgi:hypothetical protein